MFDTKDFTLSEHSSTFDFKGFLVKTGSYWKLFLVSWLLAFTIAYQINIRKEKIYQLSNTISVKEETNPFFTANTSLVFNWGGTSDKVQTVSTMLRSRSHNEEVISRLQFYINYLEQGEYNLVDAYGSVPFQLNLNEEYDQLTGQLMEIQFLTANTFQLSIPFEDERVNLFNYKEKKDSHLKVKPALFQQKYKVGEEIKLPFLNCSIQLKETSESYIEKQYFIRLDGFDQTVARYQNVEAQPISAGSSILTLSMQGTNKAKIVDYLNTTVEVLSDNQLAAKNQFATNTIKFIDDTMLQMEQQLKDSGDELKAFRQGKDVIQLENGGADVSTKLSAFELQQDAIQRKIAYYNTLKAYLINSKDFSTLPAPSVAGIEDPNITVNVSKLISLSVQRAERRYAVKSDKMFQDFDSQMQAIKEVLLVNIAAAKVTLQYDLNMVTAKMKQAQNALQVLPENQQELFKIQRKYNLSDNIYSSFLSKRNEAEIVKAANVSDIKFIDTAKDTGGGIIGPKTGVNYILAFFVGVLVPFLYILIVFLLNNTIQYREDLEKITQIPILGVIGKNQGESNLAVFERSKSALAESFRAIRSSLQFLYKKQNVTGAKILMITSSVSGEGKTFCSINIATVFALSEKKTVIVGLDLRKPKLFEDFKGTNAVGVVNYLIGTHTLEEVTQATFIPHLDLITAGPLPPNPGELLMSDRLHELMERLKEKYDYIILDTPPIGLVSDAMELSNFADVVLYIVRQNYTTKGMIGQLNIRQKRGELKNVSVVLNAFDNNQKYGYHYGYGAYGNGYHDEEIEKKSLWQKRFRKK
ncbi:polysaccharide biosynthesis tyrosine autokinase [Flavobacterium tegetincola]|uniref:polysaccharide biosynthesis tyrosine autokinase n=1 Tax=Flavobacterium tegetincola TaxID=150172 RepID=UPI0004023E86|nr:tyrosine-protein kinase domain-containing protein [Flavobacterium tegetincola]